MFDSDCCQIDVITTRQYFLLQRAQKQLCSTVYGPYPFSTTASSRWLLCPAEGLNVISSHTGNTMGRLNRENVVSVVLLFLLLFSPAQAAWPGSPFAFQNPIDDSGAIVDYAKLERVRRTSRFRGTTAELAALLTEQADMVRHNNV